MMPIKVLHYLFIFDYDYYDYYDYYYYYYYYYYYWEQAVISLPPIGLLWSLTPNMQNIKL